MDPTHPAVVDKAWQAYYNQRAEASQSGRPLGWNPRHIFTAGYLAGLAAANDGEVRSSGWSAVADS